MLPHTWIGFSNAAEAIIPRVLPIEMECALNGQILASEPPRALMVS